MAPSGTRHGPQLTTAHTTIQGKMPFYRVERHGRLSPGFTILSTPSLANKNGDRGVGSLYGGPLEDDLQRHVDWLFPQGLTDQGHKLFLKGSCHVKRDALDFLNRVKSLPIAREGINKALGPCNSAIIDIVFEYARAAYFRDKPSRYTSVFAWETVDAAKGFQVKYGGEIWEVACEKEPFKADMNLANCGSSALSFSYLAHRYWSGLPGVGSPSWELLLVPPVQVIRKL